MSEVKIYNWKGGVLEGNKVMIVAKGDVQRDVCSNQISSVQLERDFRLVTEDEKVWVYAAK